MSKNRFKFLLTTFLAVFVVSAVQAQTVEPPFWWSNMPVESLQLMINHEGIRGSDVSVDYPGVTKIRQVTGDSPNYLFLYLSISPEAEPGTLEIKIKSKKKTKTIPYELKVRDNDPLKNQGFSSKDVIYLLMPDRFANGNPDNDSFDDMLEKADRSDPNARHGGDIAGILQNLDYIKDLGMTAVWTTPVFENDMSPAYGAYHGYAATDFYKIDRRFGTNEEYRKFVTSCHKQDIKVIMDMIHNHIGDKHPWMQDLPFENWVHDLDTYGTTNYRGVIQSDPYKSQYDLDKLEKGWFVNEMPDLNQHNEQLADYLIQNTIWWIEFSGIDGIRMDTYVYPYKDYMARWAREVLDAYPDFNIVGEAWIETVAHESYWQEDLPGQDDGYESHLPNVTDFQIHFAIRDAMNQEPGWDTGLKRIYYALSQDRLYSDPMKNVIFLDNHDLERFYTLVNESKEKFMMSYAFLMTTRGIPQVYYGTELMFANVPTPDDSRKRPDMPGGWEGDERTVFTEDGRTDLENEIYDYVRNLTSWRQTSTAIHEGKLVHFLPENNVYVFFRYTDDERVMVVMNKNPEPAVISRKKHIELLRDFSKGKEVVTGASIDIEQDFQVPGLSTSIYELEK